MSSESDSVAGKHYSYPVLFGFVAGIVVASVISLSVRTSATPSTTDSTITGEFEIDYMYETTPSEASGSRIPASRIQFHASYVVVTDKKGNTFLWATNRLRKFEVINVANRK